jgi:hypothetical protein
MGYQNFANALGINASVLPFDPIANPLPSTLVIDATGESAFLVGYIRLSSGAGTTKTLSSAGGKIHFKLGTTTFANGATNLRIGVQDASATTGLEDGTFDAYIDAVPGVVTLTSSIVNAVSIATGSKDITHGDLIAVGLEFTARAGADSLQIGLAGTGNNWGYPHASTDTGAGPTVRNSAIQIAIEFDDGTIGWFGSVTPNTFDFSLAFNSGSTPDEYGLIYQFPFPTKISGYGIWLTDIATTDDFELILYSDPLGTPVAVNTYTVDASSVLSALPLYFDVTMTSLYTLAANTPILLAVRPTTANNITLTRIALGSGGANLRKMFPCGTDHATYSRSNQSGAFGSADDVNLLASWLWLGAFDDGSGGGGGASFSGGIYGG